MRLLRDFHCDSCGAEFERYIDSEAKFTQCSCGENAYRMMGMPRVSLDGTDAGFPGAYSRWASIREENARIKANKFSAEI